mgnify:CR=1 FL=1
MEETKTETLIQTEPPQREEAPKIKTRQGSGYLKQLYSTARTTAGATHSNLKNLTTFLVNFVPTDKVDASELQVRVHFDDAEVLALSESIKSHGVLQPILVVQDGDRYKVIAGERRLRASRLAGIDRIPARVLSTNDKATHEIALRENLDRVDLHPIEEGEGYVSLLEAQAYTSHDAIAKAFNKPKSRVTECIGFTRLPSETKVDLMKRGIKNRAFLRSLLSVATDQQLAVIAKVADKEEVLGNVETMLPLVAAATESIAEKAKEKKRTGPVWEYKFDDKALAAPGFRWKIGEGRERLQAYATALKKLMAAVDDRLTQPEN